MARIKVASRMQKAIRKMADDTARELAEYCKEQAEKGAYLDPEEVAYSIFRGHDNLGEFSAYASNFKVKKIEKPGTYNYRAFNDYLVFFDRIGENVPYGNFIEWGTGTAGGGAPPGMDYTLQPWDERTREQYYDNGGIFGMNANPHWSRAREKTIGEIKNILSHNLKELR